jgi:hypothetical protein
MLMLGIVADSGAGSKAATNPRALTRPGRIHVFNEVESCLSAGHDGLRTIALFGDMVIDAFVPPRDLNDAQLSAIEKSLILALRSHL